jgi:hypothetical protein
MMEKVTGKTRYRATFFGKMILQVEVSYYDDMPHGGVDRVKWRDANLTDFTTNTTPPAPEIEQ